MQTAYDDFICLFFIFFKGQMESLIKNNHCGLYPPEHVSRAGKINPDYFLCRFHVLKFIFIYKATLVRYETSGWNSYDLSNEFVMFAT